MKKIVLRAEIIGSGFAAKFHYEALQRVFSTKVDTIGAYSTSQGKAPYFYKAQEFAKEKR